VLLTMIVNVRCPVCTKDPDVATVNQALQQARNTISCTNCGKPNRLQDWIGMTTMPARPVSNT
jgi:hypothetical protein